MSGKTNAAAAKALGNDPIRQPLGKMERARSKSRPVCERNVGKLAPPRGPDGPELVGEILERMVAAGWPRRPV
jgi:hypothetical protein